MRIFFAGPLTDLKNPDSTKEFYKKLAQVAADEGHEYFLAFLNGTDPIKNPDVSPNTVYSVDTAELEKSDLLVAYVGEPSTGTGIEVEYANNNNIPVVLLYESSKKVSRMLLGSPIVKKEIVYKNEADCLDQFRIFLQQFSK
jgi:2'-deoxynucleoside 5'-phosphate N-hydrolase